MAYVDFERIKKVVKLEPSVYKEIAKDKNAMLQAVIVLYAASLISALWEIMRTRGDTLLWIVIFTPIGWVIGTGILHIIAKILGGKASFEEYLKVTGYSEAPSALGIVPVLGTFVGGIWSLACLYVATKEVHSLSSGKALIAILVPLVLLLLFVIVAVIIGIGLFGAYTMGMYGAPPY